MAVEPSPATLSTNSERQIGEQLKDSFLMDISTPEYLFDVFALRVPPTTYQVNILVHVYCRASDFCDNIVGFCTIIDLKLLLSTLSIGNLIILMIIVIWTKCDLLQENIH